MILRFYRQISDGRTNGAVTNTAEANILTALGQKYVGRSYGRHSDDFKECNVTNLRNALWRYGENYSIRTPIYFQTLDVTYGP